MHASRRTVYIKYKYFQCYPIIRTWKISIRLKGFLACALNSQFCCLLFINYLHRTTHYQESYRGFYLARNRSIFCNADSTGHFFSLNCKNLWLEGRLIVKLRCLSWNEDRFVKLKRIFIFYVRIACSFLGRTHLLVESSYSSSYFDWKFQTFF